MIGKETKKKEGEGKRERQDGKEVKEAEFRKTDEEVAKVVMDDARGKVENLKKHGWMCHRTTR